MTHATTFAKHAARPPAEAMAGPVIASASLWSDKGGCGFASITFQTAKPDTPKSPLDRLQAARDMAEHHRHHRRSKLSSTFEAEARAILHGILRGRHD